MERSEGTRDPEGGMLHDDLALSAAMCAVWMNDWRWSSPSVVIPPATRLWRWMEVFDELFRA